MLPPAYEHLYVAPYPAHGFASDPVREATGKVNAIWTTLPELFLNREYIGPNSPAIFDPEEGTGANLKDLKGYFAKHFGPMVTSQSGSPDDGITMFEHILGLREAPFEIQEPEKVEKSENRQNKTAQKMRGREKAQEQP